MGAAGDSALKASLELDELLLGKRASLNPILNPKTVAVIGAPERPGTAGYKALSSLLNGPLADKVFPVDAKRAHVMSAPAYPTISAVPTAVDLAVIASPAEAVPGIIGECVQAQVKGAIVLSTGFNQGMDEGGGLERQICERLRGSRLRVLGPDSLGAINPHIELNATPGLPMPLGGSVAFISESGALGAAIIEWSLTEIVGLSAFVSTGSMIDVGWGDLIDYFGSDPRTQTILLYMESIRNVRSFLSAAREVSLNKPIIAIKGGRSATALRALGWQPNGEGDDKVVDAAFRRVGVIRVETINDLFYTADALSKQPRPRGPRLMVVSNAIGPGMLAADSIVASGGELAELSPPTRQEFERLLPSHGSRHVAGDVCGDGSPEGYVKAVEVAANDGNCDGLLLVTVPSAFNNPRRATELLLNISNTGEKPILACLIGGETATTEEIVTRACIPTLPSPRMAARVFGYMWQYSYNLRGLYETPVLRSEGSEYALRQLAASMIHNARDGGRTVLTEVESKSLLAAYGIAMLENRVAVSEDEAVRIAGEIGYPIGLQVSSGTMEAIEGVPFDLLDSEAVRRVWRLIASRVKKAGVAESFTVSLRPLLKPDRYELHLGSKVDPQFGPVVLFGLGGKLGNVFEDRAVGLPPLNATLARRMMERTRIYAALRATSGREAFDSAGLEALLVRFSQMVVEQPRIRESEIKLLAAPRSLLAVDARVEVHAQEVRPEDLPRPAIRPYPAQYVCSWTMKDGQVVTIRPIRAEDEPLMVRFHERLSDHSVYLRYFQGIALSQRTTHDRLTRICFIDYEREIALVAEHRNPVTQERQIIALGNLVKMHRGNDGEIAAITSDDYQGRGLGSEMLRRLLQVARDENLERVIGTTLPENRQMMAMLKRLGFRVKVHLEDNLVEGVLPLRP